MTDTELIACIRAARVTNNINWMHILSLALAHAPAETRAILRNIATQDRAILAFTDQLAANDLVPAPWAKE